LAHAALLVAVRILLDCLPVELRRQQVGGIWYV